MIPIVLLSIQNDYLYQRVFALTNSSKGWAGVMWGATDGMAGGQSTVLSVPTQYAAIAEENYSYKKGKPSLLPDQSIPASNVTGMTFETNTGLDVSFVRPLAPKYLNHTSIPSKAGVKTNVSYAYSDTYFGFHAKNAVMLSIDIAGVASGVVEKQHDVAKLISRHARRHASKPIHKWDK